MSESNYERASMLGQSVKVGSTSFTKYFDNTTQKWERCSGSGAPSVVVAGGSTGITGSSYLDGDFYITGSAITLAVTGSLFLTDSTGTPNKIVDGKLRVSSMPYLFDIAEGNVPNHAIFTKLGNVNTVVNVEQDIWSQGGKYVFPTTTGSVRIQSTSGADHSTGSGIRTLKLGYLDQDYVSKSETITMTGLTPVTSVNTDYFRINSIRAVTVGSNSSAVGTIRVSGSTNSNILRILNVSQTRGRALIYTVPSGSITYITGMNLSSVAVAAGHYSTFTMRSNFDDVLYNKTAFMEPWFEITLQDQTQTFLFDLPIKIPSTCNVVGSVIAETSNANTVCYASWRGWTEN